MAKGNRRVKTAWNIRVVRNANGQIFLARVFFQNGFPTGYVPIQGIKGHIIVTSKDTIPVLRLDFNDHFLPLNGHANAR